MHIDYKWTCTIAWTPTFHQRISSRWLSLSHCDNVRHWCRISSHHL